MRKSGWTPSIVPTGDEQNVYIVVDDFGRNGRCYRELRRRCDLQLRNVPSPIQGFR